MESLEERVQEIGVCLGSRKAAVITRNFNANSPVGVGSITNNKGKVILEFINQHDLDVIHDNARPTLRRA